MKLLSLLAMAALLVSCTRREQAPTTPPVDQSSPAESSAVKSAPLTYWGSVAPIMETHCTSCHAEGGIGPMSLTSFADVKTHLGSVVAQTSGKHMPPWLPDTKACAPLTVWLPLALSYGCGDIGPHDDEPLASPAAQAATQTTPTTATDPLCGQTPATMGPKVFLDVGHAGYLSTIARAGDRVVAQGAQRWVLWDAATRTQIANGTYSTTSTFRADDPNPSRGPRFVDVDTAGDVALTPGSKPLQLDLRSARDGKVLATLPLDNRAVTLSGLARDGSYAYAATDQVLRVWDRTGKLLHELTGAYVRGTFVAAEPDALRVGSESAQTVTVLKSDGTRTETPPHAGVFRSWFLDATHFLTVSAATVDVHRADGTLAGQIPITAPAGSLQVGGDGQFVWIAETAGRRVRVFRREGGAPVMELKGTPLASRRTSQQGFQLTPTRARLLDLRGSEPIARDRDMPFTASSFSVLSPVVSVDDTGAWAVGGQQGLLFVSPAAVAGPAARLGCGPILGLASAGDQFVVGTDDDRIRFYDLSSGAPRLTRTLEGERLSTLAYADQGRYLAIRGRGQSLNDGDASIRVLDVTTGGLVHTWPDNLDASAPDAMHHSDVIGATQADRIARLLCTRSGEHQCRVEVAKVDGTELFRTPSLALIPFPGTVALSPDGTRVSVALRGADGQRGDMHVYDAHGLVASVAKVGEVMWLDDARMLITQRQDGVGTLVTITDALGNPLTRLPPTDGFGRKRDDSTDYFAGTTSVYRVADGAALWDARRTTDLSLLVSPMSAIVRKHVVFAANHQAVVDDLP